MVAGIISQRKQHILSDKDRVFCSEYAVDFNQKRAAIVAGYSTKGATVAGSKLLSKPHIQQEIRRIVNRKLQASEVRLDQVLERLRSIAFRDVLDLCDADGYIRLNRLDHLPAEIRYCIEGIEVKHELDREGEVVGQTIKVKLASSLQALDMFMKYFGAYAPEKHEHKVVEEWDSSYPPPNVPSNIVLEIPKGDYSVGELYDGQVGEKHDEDD